MDVKQLKIEVRKHHVTPGVYVLDLAIEADGEKVVKQTQHKEGDKSLQSFVKEAIRIGKELSSARIE